MPDASVIVIGSGPAGMHAAQTLVEAGADVLLIDGGKTGPSMHDATAENFTDVRRHDPEQWKWFLGKDLSAIGLEGLTGGLGGGQISGNRSYVADVKPNELPTNVRNGIVVQSLAEGGLGAGWGAACALLTPQELMVMGLPENLEKEYETIGKRIGISGPPTHAWMQPALPLDHHAASVQRYAARKEHALREQRVKAGQPYSAILTKPLHGRNASPLADMEYWADPGRSVYRPQYTLEELKKSANFTYRPGLVAEKISGESGQFTVECKTIGDQETKQSFTAKRVILGASAVNSARILLASLGIHNADVPFLGKPRAFSVCLNPHALGGQGATKRISLCQYTLLDETPLHDLPRGYAQLYSYRSMLLFRLLGSIPLPAPQAFQVASVLSPALVIADIRFPVTLQNAAVMRLSSDGNMDLRFAQTSRAESKARAAAWSSIRRALRTVHLFPMKNMTLPEGSTAHYAGTIPNTEKGRYPLTSDPTGQSNEMPGVYIADASTYTALSPKPHTLTIMANASRVATNALRTL